jgi:hypothetical protein
MNIEMIKLTALCFNCSRRSECIESFHGHGTLILVSESMHIRRTGYWILLLGLSLFVVVPFRGRLEELESTEAKRGGGRPRARTVATRSYKAVNDRTSLCVSGVLVRILEPI